MVEEIYHGISIKEIQKKGYSIQGFPVKTEHKETFNKRSLLEKKLKKANPDLNITACLITEKKDSLYAVPLVKKS